MDFSAEGAIRSKMSKLRRRDSMGRVYCDMCGVAPYEERHHIISKHATMGNAPGRKLANGHLVTALLCASCHYDADKNDQRDKLWRNLYVINGSGDAALGHRLIKEVFDKIQEEGVWLGWQIPD